MKFFTTLFKSGDRIILAVFLLLLLTGVVYATDVSTDSNVEITATVCPAGGCNGGGGGGGSSGGGGGGGIGPVLPPVTSVTISGRAYPASQVTILKDGQVAVTTVAGPDANFYVALTNLTTGNFVFGVQAEDGQGNRSALYSFPLYITSGAITNITGIFLSPSINVDKSEVKQGDPITIFGLTTPASDVKIAIHSDQEHLVTATSDANGVYLYKFDTSPLETGQHSTQSRTVIGGEVSFQSNPVNFLVGSKNVAPLPKEATKVDFNGDDRINIVDFSVAAYWYRRPDPPAEYDLNGDNKIDLVDFSIMAYYWTG